jgi:hypothetical protein
VTSPAPTSPAPVPCDSRTQGCGPGSYGFVSETRRLDDKLAWTRRHGHLYAGFPELTAGSKATIRARSLEVPTTSRPGRWRRGLPPHCRSYRRRSCRHQRIVGREVSQGRRRESRPGGLQAERRRGATSRSRCGREAFQGHAGCLAGSRPCGARCSMGREIDAGSNEDSE